MGTRQAPMDQELETALRLVRDAHGKKILAKESEIAQLRDDLGKKVGEIKMLELKVLQLETQLGKSEKKVQDLTKAVNRLNNFKQTVMDSFADVADDLPDDFSAKQRGLSVDLDGGRQTPSRKADMESVVRDEGLPTSSLPRISSPGIGLRRDQAYLISDPVSPLKRTQNGDHNDEDCSDNVLSEDILNSTQRFTTNNFASKPPSNSKVFYSPANNSDARERGRSMSVISESSTPAFQSKSNISKEAAARSNSSSGIGGRATPDPRRTNSTVNFQDEYDSGEANGPEGSSSVSNEQRRSPSVRGSGRDGREFFKVARGVLSYDEFTSLLWHVRAYNNREQSRQRTFEALDQLFGRKHPQLFNQFEKMWNQ